MFVIFCYQDEVQKIKLIMQISTFIYIAEITIPELVSQKYF